MVKCREMMGTLTQVCMTTDTVFQVSQMMKNNNLSAIPVVATKQSQELIGLVAERDIALRVVGESLPAQTQVLDIMTVNVATCSPEDDVQKAIKLMADLQIHHLPIVDENNHILGMIDKDVASLGRDELKDAPSLEPATLRKR